jgi:hypothetical protein
VDSVEERAKRLRLAVAVLIGRDIREPTPRSAPWHVSWAELAGDGHHPGFPWPEHRRRIVLALMSAGMEYMPSEAGLMVPGELRCG